MIIIILWAIWIIFLLYLCSWLANEPYGTRDFGIFLDGTWKHVEVTYRQCSSFMTWNVNWKLFYTCLEWFRLKVDLAILNAVLPDPTKLNLSSNDCHKICNFDSSKDDFVPFLEWPCGPHQLAQFDFYLNYLCCQMV